MHGVTAVLQVSRQSGRAFAASVRNTLATSAIVLCLSPIAPPVSAAPLASVVVTKPVMRDVVETIPLTGTVVSRQVARLSTQVAGLVQDITVDAGDRVSSGDVLVQLDAALAKLDGDAARAAVDLAREELADARRRQTDAERLRKSRGIPETEVEARRSEVRADAATLRLREAEAAREDERLRRFVLSAPFDGVISAKLSEQGEWVAPGDQVLELVADHDLRIDFQVPQRYFPRVREGAHLDARFASLPERDVPAHISSIVPVSDRTARTFVIRTLADDRTLPLTHGMSASGTLALATGEQRLVIPRDALLRQPDGRVTAWVIDGEDDANGVDVRERQVETGLAFDGVVVVHSGIAPGDRVVVEGNEALRQGQRVTIRGVR